MDKKYSNLTLQEKTELSNKYISLYRSQDDKRYKELAFAIIEPDVRKFCQKKFYSYPKLMDDIIGNAFLVVNKYMNKGSSFDPEMGVYIVVYLQNAITSAGNMTIDVDKTPWKYDIKKRRILIKKLKAIVDEHNLQSLSDAIEIYIGQIQPNCSESERNSLRYEINNILSVTTAVNIPDDRQDEDAVHSELVDNNSNFVEKLELVYEVRYLWHMSEYLFEKGGLTKLQFKVLKYFLRDRLKGNETKKSELASEMGMTRQNFCRALNGALAVLYEYRKKHYDDDENR